MTRGREEKRVIHVQDVYRRICQMPIRKVSGGYKIENVPGISKTYQAAVKRLQAIKAEQRRKRRASKDS